MPDPSSEGQSGEAQPSAGFHTDLALARFRKPPEVLPTPSTPEQAEALRIKEVDQFLRTLVGPSDRHTELMKFLSRVNTHGRPGTALAELVLADSALGKDAHPILKIGSNGALSLADKDNPNMWHEVSLVSVLETGDPTLSYDGPKGNETSIDVAHVDALPLIQNGKMFVVPDVRNEKGQVTTLATHLRTRPDSAMVNSNGLDVTLAYSMAVLGEPLLKPPPAPPPPGP